jgi:indolepyruvate ferredoxin oxidoreductase
LSEPAITLDDKYETRQGRIYLSGLQAMVRIPIMQRWLDQQAGLNTGAFISGYRGSPLGGVDQALERAKKQLDALNIHFWPGVNEDLGATAVWGTQQLGLGPGAKYDGVVGLWYGKGPGVDRSLDAIKHANAAGTARHGGVLAYAGDDHACKSSTMPHQSEQAFIHAMVPVMNPAGIGDALEMGLAGIALSRYSGLWVGFKILSELADSSASVISDPFALSFRTPDDFAMPERGLNLRWYDAPVEQEARLITQKIPAALAWARANRLDRLVFGAAKPRLAILTTGKAYMDTRQALDDLGIDEARAKALGIGIYKVAMVWPLEPEGIKRLAEGCAEFLVAEEKRGVIEDQAKHILYHMSAERRPRISGKHTPDGAPLLHENYELSPVEIAAALVARLKALGDVETAPFEARLAALNTYLAPLSDPAPVIRKPWYCAGCPHNTSTVVPEGSRALAGIGCHYMVMWMDRNTTMFTQMGGEGVPWIGQAPFTAEKHIFVNLGDGTYFHSGILAIRAAVSAGINITYKILYNDAVAMTGGQPVDGPMDVPRLARQVMAEGVSRVVVVADDPEKYPAGSDFSGAPIRPREELDAVQKELREVPGVTILIYDQTCAAEKRRRRKRGLMADPPKRVFINEAVCEGCGDCGKQSNCVAIVPVETEYGRKRQIDQSACNKDYSCLKGFCPSFVTVEGGKLRKPKPATLEAPEGRNDPFSDMPEPILPVLAGEHRILVTGVGGTGVVTIGALLAMAAHIEGKGCTTMDQTGLAQKGGAVTSHIRLASSPADIHTVRIGAGGADVIIGADLLVTADGDALSKIEPGRTRVILNTHETPTGDFTRNADWRIPIPAEVARVAKLAGKNLDCLDASQIATSLLGDSIATNMFLVGYAWQKGMIPLAEDSILRAIDLNAVAVTANKSAFLWGRRAAFRPDKLAKIIEGMAAAHPRAPYRRKSQDLKETVDRRAAALTRYQNAGYARRFAEAVAKVQAAEAQLPGKPETLTEAVARGLYKLMAYKDEYDVARLYTDGNFMNDIEGRFEGEYRLKFHLAPPIFAKRDSKGHLVKREFGSWVFSAFKLLARMRFLRGTALDVFGYTEERRMERKLRDDYAALIARLLPDLKPENHATLLEIARLPEKMRGFGHVKEANVAAVKAEEKRLVERFYNPEQASPFVEAAE